MFATDGKTLRLTIPASAERYFADDLRVLHVTGIDQERFGYITGWTDPVTAKPALLAQHDGLASIDIESGTPIL
jgi:hypothetical protein